MTEPVARLSLRARDRVFGFDRTLILGVLNVTPDSFSDGGRWMDLEAALARGLEMSAEGADLIDVGGESTRPGAAPVGVSEELERVLPVVEALAARGVAVSIDTRKPVVAAEALARGACLVNDVSGLGDEMLAVIAGASAGAIAMHMQGTPETMQRAPHYDDVVAEVRDFLAGRIAAARAVGVPVMVDPGIGFGKSLEHNLELLRNLDALAALGAPVLVGVSRKSFLARLTGDALGDRRAPTLAAGVAAVLAGAHALRVHDVAAAVAASRVAEALRTERRTKRRHATLERVEIRGLRRLARVGVGASERARPQALVIDLVLELDRRAAVASDELATTVDYVDLAELLESELARRTDTLLENLARALGEAILGRWYAVSSVEVRLAKVAVAERLGAEAVVVSVALER
jgi:dihydropteroate synthase